MFFVNIVLLCKYTIVIHLNLFPVNGIDSNRVRGGD